MSHRHKEKQFPALAPGPPRMFAPQTSTAISKPKKNSMACIQCKTAKRKCSGPEAPCKACAATGHRCIFDPSKDLRRKVAVKRTIAELTNHKVLLDTLTKTLKSAKGRELDRILNLIRAGASREKLARAVGSPATKFGNPEELSKVSKLATLDDGDHAEDRGLDGLGRRNSDASDPSFLASSPEETQLLRLPPRPAVNPYSRVLLESLCDIPLFEVPAHPWTEVTDSDHLVSHLVSLYFTWDHPCSQFLDQRMFIEHMSNADLESEFCTPLLVNSLLAMASAHSENLDVLSDTEDTYSRGQLFLDEAQQLWEAEEEDIGSLLHPSLPTIQALLLMCCVFKLQNRMGKSWHALERAVMLAQAMRLFDDPMLSDTITPEIKRNRAITAWGIFNLSVQISVEQNIFVIGPLAYPVADIALCGDEDTDWTPYPRSNKITYEKQPARLPEIRRGLVDITKVLSDVQTLLSEINRGTSSDDIWKKAKSSFEGLTAWLQKWPAVMDMQSDPLPQVLLLRIKCHEAIISLVRVLEVPNSPKFIQQAQNYQIESAHKMAECLRVHRRSYGLKNISSQMVSATQIALGVMAQQMETTEEFKDAFAELCHFAISLSEKYKETAAVISDIGDQVLQHHPILH